MTTHLVTFASDDMSKSAELCVKSAELHGVGSSRLWHFSDLQRCRFYGENKTLLDRPRGIGFWSWKPWIIQFAFQYAADGDILIYADAGIEFINNVNYIIDRMDQDIFLFGNQWEHAHWCKRDIVDAVWPDVCVLPEDCSWECPWHFFGKQVQASVIFFRVNDKTRAFVKEWLDWCLFEGGRLIDDSPSRTPNHPEFRENRHDQAILTTMAYRDGYRLHWWPAEYNDGAFVYERGDYPDDGYPVLFHHHRKRNHEFEAAA